MGEKLRLLMLEDCPDDALLLRRHLQRAGIDGEILHVDNRDALIDALDTFDYDILLSDFVLPTLSGLDAIELALAAHPLRPVVVVTGSVDERIAAECMGRGASAYVLKDDLSPLVPAIFDALDRAKVRRETEAAIARERQTARLLAAIRQIQRLIVHSDSRQQVIDAACEMLVGTLDFGRAWIVILSRDRVPSQIASCGFGADLAPRLEDFEDPGYANCVTPALQSDTVSVVHPSRESCQTCKLSKHCSACDRLAVRLAFEGRTYGLLAAALAEDGEPPLESIELFQELSTDLAYALRGFDVSEEKEESQRQLAESEERFEALFERAPLAYQALDSNGRFKRVNRAWEEQLGYSRDEILGTSFGELLVPGSAFSFEERFAAFRKQGHVEGVEWVMRKKNGQTAIFVFDGRVALDERGGFLQTHCILKDVTDRRVVEKQLERELAVSQALADLSTALLNPERSIGEMACHVLRHAQELTGAEHGFVSSIDPLNLDNVGHTLTQMMPSCPVAGGEQKVAFPIGEDGLYGGLWGAALNLESPVLTNTPATHPAASGLPAGHVPLENFLAVPAVIAGRPVGMIALANSPTGFSSDDQATIERLAAHYALAIQRHDDDQALAHSEERYRALLDDIEEVVFELTVDGEFVFISPGIEKWLGVSSDELIGNGINDVLPIMPATLFAQAIAKVETTEQASFEFAMPRPNGVGERWLLCTYAPVREAGKLVGIRGLAADISLRRQAEVERQQSISRLRAALGGTIQAFTRTVEMRDPYTAGHQRRVADLARAIAHEMALDAERVEGIRVAAAIHDLGKISIPSEILSKPGRLLPVEFALVKSHAETGHEILASVTFPWPVADAVHQHHERLDGSGYPQGLKGDDILLEARIIGVADVVEAMASHRPYRAALGVASALTEIQGQAGTLYDPVVVAATVRLFQEQGYQLK